MSSVEYRLSELERRLANLLLDGVVAELNEETARVRVQYAADDKGAPVLTGWLPWFTRRAGEDRDWWAPEPGEPVMVLSVGGDLSQGRVLPSLYCDAHPAPANSKTVRRATFADGTVIEYDRAAHLLKADVKGSAQLIASGTLVADITGNTTITSPLTTVNGDFHVNGEVTGSKNIVATENVGDQNGAKTMAGMRTVSDGHTHNENGDGGGVTDSPNQQM